MEADRISMVFFRNAGTVCLVAAAAAFIAALIMFFAFDIPTIFKVRKRLSAQVPLRTNVRTVIRKDSAREIHFQIVRKIIITDSDETIDLRDIFGRQDRGREVDNERHSGSSLCSGDAP